MIERCFVIIPFKGHYESIYTDVIKPTLADLDVEAFISKDVKGIEWPFKKIHAGIRDSRFCIADITELNENVMYEIGYASALEKKTILMWDTSKRKKNPSFDMNYFHGEIYNSKSDNSWSLKLARTIKEHFVAELKKPAKEHELSDEVDQVDDDIGLLIKAIILKSEAQKFYLNESGLIGFMQNYGWSADEIHFVLKTFKQDGIIRAARHNSYQGQVLVYEVEKKYRTKILERMKVLPDTLINYEAKRTERLIRTTRSSSRYRIK